MRMLFQEGATVVVVAPGSGAVVAFEPPHLDFGSLLVNNTSDASFTLVNASDCDVQYELHHKVAPEKKAPVRARAGSSLASSQAAGGDDDDVASQVRVACAACA